MKVRISIEDRYFNMTVEPIECKLLAWQLQGINNDIIFSYVEQGICEVEKRKIEEWHMSFNSTFIQITKDRVRCSCLFDDSDYIDISIKKFLKILVEWKDFLDRVKNDHIDHRKTLEFEC